MRWHPNARAAITSAHGHSGTGLFLPYQPVSMPTISAWSVGKPDLHGTTGPKTSQARSRNGRGLRPEAAGPARRTLLPLPEAARPSTRTSSMRWSTRRRTRFGLGSVSPRFACDLARSALRHNAPGAAPTRSREASATTMTVGGSRPRFKQKEGAPPCFLSLSRDERPHCLRLSLAADRRRMMSMNILWGQPNTSCISPVWAATKPRCGGRLIRTSRVGFQPTAASHGTATAPSAGCSIPPRLSGKIFLKRFMQPVRLHLRPPTFRCHAERLRYYSRPSPPIAAARQLHLVRPRLDRSADVSTYPSDPIPLPYNKNAPCRPPSSAAPQRTRRCAQRSPRDLSAPRRRPASSLNTRRRKDFSDHSRIPFGPGIQACRTFVFDDFGFRPAGGGGELRNQPGFRRFPPPNTHPLLPVERAKGRTADGQRNRRRVPSVLCGGGGRGGAPPIGTYVGLEHYSVLLLQDVQVMPGAGGSALLFPFGTPGEPQ